MCPDLFDIMIDVIAVIITIQLFMISLPALGIFVMICVLCFFFAPRHYVCCGISQIAESRHSEWKHRNDPDRQEDKNDKVHQVLNELKERGLVDENVQVKIMHDWK